MKPPRLPVRLGLGLLLGALPALAFHPLDFWPLMAVGLAPTFVVARRWQGGGLGALFFAFGLGYMSVGCAWLYGLFWIAGFLMALGCAVVFYLPYGWLFGMLLRRTPYPLILVAPVSWIALDWTRHWLLTGFPWLLPGHVLWHDSFLLGVTAFVGVHGLSLMLLATNAALAAWILRERRRLSAITAAATVAVGLVLGAFGRVSEETAASGPVVRIAAIQGNIAQDIKERALLSGETSPEQFVWDRHLALTEEAVAERPDLIIWPETTLPGYADLDRASGSRWARATQARLAEIADVARGIPVLVGAIRVEPPDAAGLKPRQYNAAILVGPGGAVLGRYDKVHTVPGGEYLPLRPLLPNAFMRWVERTVEEMAGFVPSMRPGERLEPIAVPGDPPFSVGPLICYEIIYPSLARAHANKGARLLVNLTNYAWFGTSAQLDQALAISVFRAVETRRPVVIAANTGISAWIDVRGRPHPLVVDGRRKEVEGVLLAEIPIGDAGTTPYLAVGDLLAWLAASLTGAGLVVATRRRSGRSGARGGGPSGPE